MPTKWRRCSNPQCPTAEIIDRPGRCPRCANAADNARRPDGNPYNTAGHRSFRAQVLDRDPICVECQVAVSVVADHYPTERRDLIDMGLDPNDPTRGRGLCIRCHNRVTSTNFGFGRR